MPVKLFVTASSQGDPLCYKRKMQASFINAFINQLNNYNTHFKIFQEILKDFSCIFENI